MIIDDRDGDMPTSLGEEDRRALFDVLNAPLGLPRCIADACGSRRVAPAHDGDALCSSSLDKSRIQAIVDDLLEASKNPGK